MENLDDILELAETAALEAGELIKGIRASGQLNTKLKATRDIVTAADIGAEKLIIEKIKNKFPDHNFLSEEGNPEQSNYKGHLWIIDPVDGTTNFSKGQLIVGISIAYAYNGEVLVGVVNSPFLNELFTAVKGRGAYLNKKEISVGSSNTLVQAVVATGFPYKRDNLTPIIKRFHKVLENCQDLRRPGAASLDLCWVACGRVDAYYEDVLPWDIAAGALIVKEAGGEINFIDGYPDSHPIPKDLYNIGLLASNRALAPKLLDILHNI